MSETSMNTQVEYKFYTYEISMLEGKLLTLTDATFSDQEQRKAFKDLIRQIVWGWAIENNEANRPSKVSPTIN